MKATMHLIFILLILCDAIQAQNKKILAGDIGIVSNKNIDNSALLHNYFTNNQTKEITIVFGDGNYYFKSPIKFNGTKLTIRGQGIKTYFFCETSIIDELKANSAVTLDSVLIDGRQKTNSAIQIMQADATSSLAVSNCYFVNFVNTFILLKQSTARVNIKFNTFNGRGINKLTAIYLANGVKNIKVEGNSFEFLYNGIYVVGKEIKQNSEITISNNYLNLGWFAKDLFSIKKDNSSIKSLKNNLLKIDTQNFALEQVGYIRIEQNVLETNNFAITNDTVLSLQNEIDNVNIEPYSLVYFNDIFFALIKYVKNKKTYIIDKIIPVNTNKNISIKLPSRFSKICIVKYYYSTVKSHEADILFLNPFKDIWGSRMNVSTIDFAKINLVSKFTNYPIHFEEGSYNNIIKGNTILNGYSDHISYYGDKAVVENNTCINGQDMGITLNSDSNTVKNNLILHHGSGGIWLDGSKSVLQNNFIKDVGWINEDNKNYLACIILNNAEDNVISDNSLIGGNVVNKSVWGIGYRMDKKVNFIRNNSLKLLPFSNK